MKKAMIDIDGVLNDFPNTLVRFCNYYLHRDYKTLEEIQKTLSYTEFRRVKKLYKFSEFKHQAKIKENAKKLIDYLKQNDYLIYIVTSRDLFENNQLELTINWLHENGIFYDFLYQSERKDVSVYENFHHFDIVVEDSLENILNIKKINEDCKYFYVYNNNHFYQGFNVYNIKNLQEIINILDGEKIHENQEI